jgi:hypothetical protein
VTRRCIPFTLPFTSFVLVLATGCLAPTAFDAEGSSEVGESTGEVSEGVTSGESSLPSIWTTTEESGSESVEEIGGCAPGSVEVCAYEGPAPTLQVGSCRAASRVCDEDGRWGACAGEVTPRVEDCGTAVDEDCDGQVACTGEVTWVRSFGQPEGGAAGSATAEALTIDSRERIWLTGGFQWIADDRRGEVGGRRRRRCSWRGCFATERRRSRLRTISPGRVGWGRRWRRTAAG